MNREEMAKAAVEGLREDLPGLEETVAQLVPFLVRELELSGQQLSTADMVYRFVLAGATIASAHYRAANKQAEEELNKIMGK